MLREESKRKWEQFLSGDEKAYGWLYKTYIQQLFRYGLRFTTDTERIKDSIQEVFTSIYKNRKQLITPDNVSVYLLVSLKNNLLRALQKEAFYEHFQWDTLPFSLVPTVEEQFIEEEQAMHQQAQVHEIFSHLTARQQEVLYHRFIQELSLNDIAELMNMNYQSVQNLLQRTLKKIREMHSGLNKQKPE